MPLNDTDKAWVRETIRDSQKTQGWGTLQKFVKDWSGFGAAVTILIILFTQWTAYIEFRSTTKSTLEDIGKRIGKIEGDLVKQSLLTQSALPSAEFRANLPTLNSTLRNAQASKVDLPNSTITGLRQRLAETDATSPGYWPVASALINYRPETQIPLPPCGKPEMAIHLTGDHFDPLLPAIGEFIYKNCTIALEDTLRTESKLTVIRSAVATYDHVHVTYKGGDILPGIIMMRFRDCTFDFDLRVPPRPEGDRLAESLLASSPDISNLDVSLKPS